MGLLEFSFNLSTWAFVLACVVLFILTAATLLKHIIPNDGDGDMVEISESARSIAKWGAFFIFLIFFILAIMTAAAEFITYGEVTNPIINAIMKVVFWLAGQMEKVIGRFFGGYAFQVDASGVATSISR